MGYRPRRVYVFRYNFDHRLSMYTTERPDELRTRSNLSRATRGVGPKEPLIIVGGV